MDVYPKEIKSVVLLRESAFFLHYYVIMFVKLTVELLRERRVTLSRVKELKLSRFALKLVCHVCVCVCVCVCVSVCVCVYMYTHTHRQTDTDTLSLTHTCVCMYI